MRFIAIVAFVFALCLPSCHPQPAPGDVPAVTPSSWVDTAQGVDDVLRWALPASDIVVGLFPDSAIPPTAKAEVHRAIGVAETDALPAFDHALVVYRQRGGDQCAVHAASGALTTALVGIAQALADAGWGVAIEIEHALAALGGIADELAGACDHDAGFASAGATLRGRLDAIRLAASARGVSLRPFPAIHAPDGGVR